jgi:hypothetical protein
MSVPMNSEIVNCARNTIEPTFNKEYKKILVFF